ncbi:activating transcription factor 7-interacting protein 2 isoform X3 [Astyanax mexicanus]|uniref:Activating transcription factor 7 interacting protein 2 n=1 Tax=Astyanax mexicanus TaxID=7994 RepID=A0A8B9JD28_ASTMX|nr:activating transcription factor 7-interacting protein 2 isoform X3 [Astyanax mexicanus]
MKRRRPDEELFDCGATSAALSKVEVRRMVSHEVRAAVERSDTMMKALMERIQEIDSEPKYDARLKKLGAHVKKIKRRGDAAFAFIRKELHQKKQQQPTNSLPYISDTRSLSSANGGCSDDSTSASAAIEINGKGEGAARKPKEGFWQRLRSKQEIVDLTDEGEDAVSIKNVGNHSDTPPPPVLKREEITANEPSKPSYPVLEESKKPPVEETRQGSLQFRLPRLPDLPFPSQLPAAAATKNLPQKPVVKVARIENPKGIALLWNVEEEDPHAPDMESYHIYVIQEFHSGTFSKWKSMGPLKALPLPMACKISDRPEVKALHFIILGKDVYGRFGPYSDVQTVTCGKT